METSPLHLHLHHARGPVTIVASAPTFPPYATPGLTANLVCRVVLAVVANLVCLVPLRLLYRNGELAAVVFILNIQVKNLETIINALIWRNDDIMSWWPGYGWCDFDAYIHNISIGLFVTCLLAIMRNLAQQVGLMRANTLTTSERRRRNLIQALIIFPFPILQLALTWPLTAQRYLVGTLMGCNWIPHPSWPFLIFFVLPPPIFALMTTVYAILIYKRFRQVRKTTETALCGNRVAQQRSQRTRRKLYLMVISILVPFLPIVMALSVLNIMEMQGLKPYSYDQVHNHASPFPWNTIIFFPSSQIGWTYMNNCYIPIATAIPIFVFFGLTKDAINNYRQVSLFFGLGAIFPVLHNEYDPDKAVTTSGNSFGSSRLQPMLTSLPSKAGAPASSNPSSQTVSMGPGSPLNGEPRRPDAHFFTETEQATPRKRRLPGHNPFLFRTRYNLAVPASLRGWFVGNKSQPNVEIVSHLDPVQSGPPSTKTYHAPALSEVNVQTTVWCGDEAKSGQPESLRIARKEVAGKVQVQTAVSRKTETIPS
ncbi:pheromone receptor [Metarhizium album ARSEF 1941]|uniref:Pheromone receptor n=1 Tax=Metarhizium album (strain ARSEF 1941) TaxID=1081103 RepID=A0A0B2X1F7_METAS|nr:pheromone receptor [Metarhizium album ARSEF 1941]KHN99512.1 pheromone receptor [Metarhizium album ARSEF 1941]